MKAYCVTFVRVAVSKMVVGLLTWLVDGVGDEILPQLGVVLLLGKLDGLVHILQLHHDHLQGPSAVSHPACGTTCVQLIPARMRQSECQDLFLLSRKTVSSTKCLCWQTSRACERNLLNQWWALPKLLLHKQTSMYTKHF